MIIGDWYLTLPSKLESLAPLSISYAAFLLAAFFLCRIFSARLRPLILIIANCFFLYSFSFEHLKYALILSGIGYLCSVLIKRYQRKEILYLSILLYIGILSYLKLPELFQHDHLLPLGISFYTFKILSYLIDLFRNTTEGTYNPLYYFSYVLFFPCITAGPIHRFDGFYQVIRSTQTFDYKDAKNGGFRVILGIYEKIVFCDYIASISEKAMSADLSGWNTLLGILLYSFAIYLDFDSYSNIALGSARLLGFRLEENFQTPYLAKSLKDFWRRWHISLSSFFRDYLYIPLGGNRKGKLIQYRNLLIIFAVSGIWHGFAWHYLLWGLLHGLLLIIEDVLFGKLLKKNSILLTLIGIPVTFTVVSFLWLPFRMENMAEVLAVLKRLSIAQSFSYEAIGMTLNEAYWLLAVTVIVILCDLLRYRRNLIDDYSRLYFPLRWIGYAVLVITFLIFGMYGGSFEASDFIYQFF
ncbi:MAG: MBOAT family protein [Erysipelotrichaceae bacterium]|nr:MBOAT family protein [Erysipelotrichaceae bacterium]